MFRSENTVPKTSFASSSLERPFRAGLPLSPLLIARPVVLAARPLECGRFPFPDEVGLPVLLVLVMFDEVVFEALVPEVWSQRLV